MVGKPTLPRTVGERVRAMRLAAGLTQVQLSERSGIGQSAISSIETGASKWLRGGNLLSIAGALDCSVNWLETGVGDPHPPVGAGTDEAIVLDILRALPTERRRTWIEVGMALRSPQPSKANPFAKAKTP